MSAKKKKVPRRIKEHKLFAEAARVMKRIELQTAARVADILCNKLIWPGGVHDRWELARAVVAELADKRIEPLHVDNDGGIYAEDSDAENVPVK